MDLGTGSFAVTTNVSGGIYSLSGSIAVSTTVTGAFVPVLVGSFAVVTTARSRGYEGHFDVVTSVQGILSPAFPFTQIGQDFADALAMWRPDSPGDDLTAYAIAVGQMFAEVEAYVSDIDNSSADNLHLGEVAGWANMMDPDDCPVAGLPYLAQWVGERLPTGLTEADQRQWIKDAPNQRRGTPYSIARASQRWLTGSRLVWFAERQKLDGTVDPDWVALRTFITQTPSKAAVIDELRKVVPADIELDYEVVGGATWAIVETAQPTWAQVLAAYSDWKTVAGVTGSWSSWTWSR